MGYVSEPLGLIIIYSVYLVWFRMPSGFGPKDIGSEWATGVLHSWTGHRGLAIGAATGRIGLVIGGLAIGAATDICMPPGHAFFLFPPFPSG